MSIEAWSLAERARSAYQQAMDSRGKDQMERVRVLQDSNAARLAQLLDQLLAVQIARDGIYFQRFDSIRPHAYIEGLEFTCQYVPLYHATVLQMVQHCPVCRQERLDVVASLEEIGAALADGPAHAGCRVERGALTMTLSGATGEGTPAPSEVL